jgi:predicted KAP-like P-loop ATPase
MNTDSPKNKKEDDILNRHLFAEQIVNGLLTSYENGSESLIIGINGAWGTGKTTLLNFIKTELKNKQRDKGIIFDFNPWLFSGQEQLQRKFFKELKETLKNSVEKIVKKVEEGKSQLSETLEKPLEITNNLYEQITEYTKSLNEEKDINWWKELLKNSGDVIGKFEGETGMFKLAGVVSKMLKDEEIKEKPINEIKETIDKSLKKLDKKIYIFIDDLDRLSQTEITQIFQLIRLNANFANTVFFVAFDKEIVVNALQKEYQKNGEHYLEKIIQVDYSLPEIPPSKIREILYDTELKNYLQLPIFEKIAVEQILETVRNTWRDGFSFYFKNLRDINRYTNAIKLRLPSIYKEIDIADFLILEAIRIFDYKVYEYIYKNKDLLTKYISSKKYKGNVEQDYYDKFKTSLASNKFKDGSESLVKNLFYLETENTNLKYYAADDNSDTQPFINFSISVSAYFDRYFTFQLFDNEIKKEEINNFFDGTVSQKVEIFEKMIGKDLFRDFAILIQKGIIWQTKEIQKSVLVAYLELGSKYPVLYDSSFCLFCRNELISIAKLSHGHGKTLFNVLSEHCPDSYSKLQLLSDLYFGIREAKEKFDNHILHNTFLRDDFDENEVEKDYKNCLLVLGGVYFDKFIYTQNEISIKEEFGLIYYQYAKHHQEIFETKIKLIIQGNDGMFLLFMQVIILYCCAWQVSNLAYINLSEKNLLAPLNKELVVERFKRINFSEITDEQQIKTYKFLQKVIENGFKEGVYYHFDTLKDVSSLL